MAEERAETLRNLRFVLSVDDVEYTLRFGEVTARDVRELRSHGLSVSDVLAGVQGTISALDQFAAAVWLARRQAGDNVDYDTLVDEFRLDQVIGSRAEDDPEPVEEFPDPPVSGGS